MEKTKEELQNLLKIHNDSIDFIVNQTKMGLFNIDLALKQVWEHCVKKAEIVEKLKKLDINI